jgi:hypothetical protein
MSEPEPLPQQLPPVAGRYPVGSLGVGVAILMLLFVLGLQIAIGIRLIAKEPSVSHGNTSTRHGRSEGSDDLLLFPDSQRSGGGG